MYKKSSDYLNIVSVLSFFSTHELQKEEGPLKLQTKLWLFHQSKQEVQDLVLFSKQPNFDNHKLLSKAKQQLLKLPLSISAFSFYSYDCTSFFYILTFLEVTIKNKRRNTTYVTPQK